jgi:hypothetical protein
MASASSNTLDPSVVVEYLQSNLDTVVGVDVSSLDPKVARILPEAMAATWEVHRLQEILLTASRMPGYSEKPII